ncbi:glutathione-dependent formaldehyde-activating protein [Salinisphaera sp. T31B1]
MRAGGGANFVVPKGQAVIKAFQSSAGERRHCCSECGSPLYSKAHERPDNVSLYSGTLDSDPIVRPTEHIYTGSKAPWLEICDGLPQFTEVPG